jgi:broad specificity phosphatase PhoE
VSDLPALPPIYFLRHGETNWNRERRIQGQTDIALNETGLGQARRMATRLAEVVTSADGFQLISSPLTRARQTMAEVLQAYGLGEEHALFDARLRELNFGAVEGKTWPEVHALGMEPEIHPERYHDWRPEGGESYADGRARVEEWLESLEGPAIVVAHGGISRILRGIVFSLDKAEIVQLKVPQDRFFRIAAGGIDWFDARPEAT